MKEYALVFAIGAQLASDFNTSFNKACTSMNMLAKEAKNVTTVMKDVSGYTKTKEALEKNQQKLEDQRAEYEGLKMTLEVTGDKGYQELTEKIIKQQEQMEKTRASIEKQRSTLDEYSQRLEAAGVNTENLTDEQEKLNNRYKELKEANETLQTITKHQNELKSKVSETRSELLKVTSAYAALGAATYKFTVAPSIEFESAFAGVEKTVDGTAEELAQIRSDILALSYLDVPASAADISAVAEAAGQLGIQTQNIMDFTETMINLGESTNLSSEEAASSLAKFANITKMDAKYYENLGSVVVDLGNNFATTESDIVAMATRLASTGEVVGLTEAQIMAVATALSSVGIEAEAGGSAVSKLLKRVDTAVQTYAAARDIVAATGYSNRELELMASLDTTAFKAVAGELGLTTTELKGYMSSISSLEQFSDVAGKSADKFIEAWGEDSVGALSLFISGLNDTERTGKSAIELLNEMGLTEVRLSNAVLSLAASDGILTKAVQTANTAWEENTALAAEAGKRYATTESQIKMAKNALTAAGIAVGDAFTPTIAEAARTVNEFAQDFAAWAKENPETIKEITKHVAAFGAFHIALKAVKFVWTDTKLVFTNIGKGLVTVRNGVMSVTKASKGAATAFTAGSAVAVVAIMAVVAALKLSHDEYMNNAKAAADLRLYNNGATTSIKDLTEALKNSSSESYEMAQSINAAAAEYEEIRSNIGEARRELEYYGMTVRDDGILDADEAAALKEPFENLIQYLEEGFSAGYGMIFKNFTNSVSAVTDSLGVDVSTMHTLLASFESGYNEKVSEVKLETEAYLNKKMSGEGTTAEEDEEFRNNIQLVYELAKNESDSLSNLDEILASTEGLDFGSDSEAAVAAMKEMGEYVAAYFEELNSAQEEINRQYEVLRANAESMYNAGKFTDEEYQTYKETLAVGNVVSQEAYEKQIADFREQYGFALSQIAGQKSNAWLDAYHEALENTNFWDSISAGWMTFGIAVNDMFESHSVHNIGENYENQLKHNAHVAADAAVSEISDAYDDLAALLESDTIELSADIRLTAAASGLLEELNSTHVSLLVQPPQSLPTIEEIKAGYTGGASLKAVETGINIRAAYAGGTDYSVDTFLAGEYGPEIVTNARGYKVYTAEETADIFDTYRQIVAILPQLAAVSVPVSAPRVEAAAQDGSGIKISLNIEQNITADDTADLEQKLAESNEQLAERVRQVLEEIRRDSGRRSYN